MDYSPSLPQSSSSPHVPASPPSHPVASSTYCAATSKSPASTRPTNPSAQYSPQTTYPLQSTSVSRPRRQLYSPPSPPPSPRHPANTNTNSPAYAQACATPPPKIGPTSTHLPRAKTFQSWSSSASPRPATAPANPNACIAPNHSRG